MAFLLKMVPLLLLLLPLSSEASIKSKPDLSHLKTVVCELLDKTNMTVGEFKMKCKPLMTEKEFKLKEIDKKISRMKKQTRKLQRKIKANKDLLKTNKRIYKSNMAATNRTKHEGLAADLHEEDPASQTSTRRLLHREDRK
ncbi:hypothetical protein WMY93_004913 [Mugilogobius chulae]|uniref:Uncharacterized protein n=1 Tax=Mugilogobius chulae TaxID=88201 RepID=A0AAW0PR08_9GOBI